MGEEKIKLPSQNNQVWTGTFFFFFDDAVDLLGVLHYFAIKKTDFVAKQDQLNYSASPCYFMWWLRQL